MPRPLPPLPAFEAFVAVMRHGGFGRAARALGITQSAVSHQIRTLEEAVGSPLFARSPTGATALPAALALLPRAERALEELRRGVDELAGAGRGASVKVSVSPSFAAKWLVPRLGRFLRAHPGIELLLDASLRHVDLAAEGVDLAVRHGDGRWPGLDARPLADEAYAPVCTPPLAARLQRPADLAGEVLLHDRARDRWTRWLAEGGLPTEPAAQGPVLHEANLVIDAALAGDGVALARTSLAAADLIAGRLVAPFPRLLAGPSGYWVLTRPGPRRREVAVLRDWLLAEAAADSRAVAACLGRAAPPAPTTSSGLMDNPRRRR
ncbi:MAG: LysR substrate-binding domain-containing protein [Geminicoccaceae bacterium]